MKKIWILGGVALLIGILVRADSTVYDGRISKAFLDTMEEVEHKFEATAENLEKLTYQARKEVADTFLAIFDSLGSLSRSVGNLLNADIKIKELSDMKKTVQDWKESRVVFYTIPK